MSGLTTRAEVIQVILERKRAQVYLEIGVKSGKTFLALRAPLKLGVDPVFTGKARKLARSPLQLLNRGPLIRAFFGRRLFRETSDAFFAKRGAMLAALGLDVAFVDGLHSYRQSLVDVYHCLEYLRPGGVIVVDDCNPPTRACATWPREEAERTPGYQGDWCGDVYKTIVDLRANRKDLEVCVLDCAFGLGIVTKKAGYAPAELPLQGIELDYADFERQRATLLNLKPPEHLFELLSE